MNLPLTRAVAQHIEWLPRTDSTNDALIERATGPDATAWPDLSLVATDTQLRGRGRLGRTWTAPAGKCLAVSVLLRQQSGDPSSVPVDSLGWLSLMAGAAMTEAVRSLAERSCGGAGGHDHDGASAGAAGAAGGAGAAGTHPVVRLKWPNDVMIDGRKVSGILGELVPSVGVVIGAGINLSLTESELPVATATSLELSGITTSSLDAALAGYVANLSRLYRAFVSHGGDAKRSGLHSTVTRLCGTLGSPVRAELPGGNVVCGTARELDETGRLCIDRDSDGTTIVVAAGDITHLKV